MEFTNNMDYDLRERYFDESDLDKMYKSPNEKKSSDSEAESIDMSLVAAQIERNIETENAITSNQNGWHEKMLKEKLENRVNCKKKTNSGKSCITENNKEVKDRECNRLIDCKKKCCTRCHTEPRLL